MKYKMILMIVLHMYTLEYCAYQRAIKPSSSYVASAAYQNLSGALGITPITSSFVPPLQYKASGDSSHFVHSYKSYEQNIHTLVDKLNEESFNNNEKFNQKNIQNNYGKKPIVDVDKALRAYEIDQMNSKQKIFSSQSSLYEQKQNFSADVLQKIIVSNFTPKDIKEFNLVPIDGKYSPKAVDRFLIYDKIDIIKVLLQNNLVLDKLQLLESLFDIGNVNYAHEILEFYKNDYDLINKALENFEKRCVDGVASEFKYSLFTSNVELIIEFIKTGLVSDNLKFKFTNHFAEFGHYDLVKKINPAWFAKEFIYHKNLIIKAQDISNEQKALLQSMYNAATISLNSESAPYELDEQLIQKMSESGLTFSQVLKYMPTQLFNTEKIFEILNATITAKLILELDPYLIQKKHHTGRAFEYDGNQGKVSPEKLLLDNGIYDKIIKIEQEMDPAQYHTFVTGRHWNFNFAQDLWNLAHAVRHDYSHMENIVELAPGLHKDHMQDHALDIQNYMLTKEKILKEGLARSSDRQGTCLNSTICENQNRKGFYTPHYLDKNLSMRYEGHTAEEIFITCGMEKEFERFKFEINRLKSLHAASSKFGELLAVSIKKDKIDSLVYVADEYASKINGSIYSNIEECRPSQVLERIYKQDKGRYPAYNEKQDNYFYYLVAPGMPGELGRDYKVQSIHITDPEIFAEYKKGIQELFEAMKKDFKQRDERNNFTVLNDYCKNFLSFHSDYEYGYNANGIYQGEDGYRDMYGNLQEVD